MPLPLPKGRESAGGCCALISAMITHSERVFAGMGRCHRSFLGMGAAGGDSECWGDFFAVVSLFSAQPDIPTASQLCFSSSCGCAGLQPSPCVSLPLPTSPPSPSCSGSRSTLAAPGGIPSASPSRDLDRRAAGAIVPSLLSVWWLWAALVVSVVSLEALGGGSGPSLGLSCLSGAASPVLPSTGKLQNPPQAFRQVQSNCRNCNSQECGRAALLGVWSFLSELLGRVWLPKA